MLSTSMVRFMVGCIMVMAFGIAHVHTQSVPSTTETLYSDSFCNSNLCLKAIYIPSQKMINYTMTASGGGTPIGWYAVGTGEKMAGSNMMIGWVNSDGSVTMSQRTASGHEEPSTTISAQAAIPNTLNSFSNSSGTSWSWSFPLSSSDSTPSSSTNYMWAVNKDNNPSSSSSASIKIHNDYGQFALDLTKVYTSSSDHGLNPSTGSGSSSSNGQNSSFRVLNKHNQLIIAHMVFMILGWMVLAPGAILVGRWGRTVFKWLPVHRNLQIAATFSVVLGFIMIVSSVGSNPSSQHFDNNHGKLGLAIFVILFVQLALGQLAHLTKRFHVSRMVHVVIGLGLTIAAIYNCTSGLKSWWEWQPPSWAETILWVWAAMLAAAYLAGLVMLRKDLRQWKQAEAQKDHRLYSVKETLRSPLAEDQDPPQRNPC